MRIINFIKTAVIGLFLIGGCGVYADTNVPTSPNSTDVDIVSHIQNKFAEDHATSGVKITIVSQDGIVVLTGTVDTKGQADQLIEIAELTPGVKEVNSSSLRVAESKQAIADAAITSKVKAAYVREKLFGNKDISVMDIKVETNNGVVYLTGKVETPEQAKNALKIAKSVTGVKKVESKLKVVK